MALHYSHSRLDTFRNCPRQYKFKYVDRVKVPDRVTADIYLGRAVHRQLAKAYSLGAEGVLYPLDDMIATYRSEWEKPDRERIAVGNEYLTVDDYIRNGEEMLKRHYEQYQPFDQGKLLGVERKIRFQLPGTRFQFMTVIDRLWKGDDEVVEICDYKTGKNLPLGGTDKTFSHQMGLYQLAVQSVYPQFDRIDLAQYFLRHNEVIRYRMSPDELDELSEKLRQEVMATVYAERKDDFPTRETGRCNYCEYFHLCPAKRHRLALEREEGSDEERITMESAAGLADQYIEMDSELKRTKAEHAALKDDIVRAARELGLGKLVGSAGEVVIRGKREEEFVTKTADADAFVRLSQLVRDWHLDECLTLDAKALMKDFYRPERLTPEQLEQLKKFVIEKDRTRVTVRRFTGPDDDEL